MSHDLLSLAELLGLEADPTERAFEDVHLRRVLAESPRVDEARGIGRELHRTPVVEIPAPMGLDPASSPARMIAEDWPVAATKEVVPCFPLRAPEFGGPFVVARRGAIESIVLGEPAIDGDDVYFPIDRGRVVLRVDAGERRVIVDIAGGTMRTWIDPDSPALPPPVAEWLGPVPAWLLDGVYERLAHRSPGSWYAAVGLAVRLGPRFRPTSLDEILALARSGGETPLRAEARAWMGRQPAREIASAIDASQSEAAALASALAAYDAEGAAAAESALWLCARRDDLESVACAVRLAGHPDALADALAKVDEVAELALPRLADGLATLDQGDPHLEGVARSIGEPWWGLPSAEQD